MRILEALKPSALYVVGVLGSAVFWALSLLLGGAVLLAVGAGLQFGYAAGLCVGGVLSVAYGAVVLKKVSA